ncbi:hypothetical protein HDV05_003630 [Chytridiales sp. JEL 0842]|nr:hypothetical protein HDV05_003630 [Chytridiales sp. JEL 0842]
MADHLDTPLPPLSFVKESPQIPHHVGMPIRIYDADGDGNSVLSSGESSVRDETDDDNSDIDATAEAMDAAIARHTEAFQAFLLTARHQPRQGSAALGLHTILKSSASSFKYKVMHPRACRNLGAVRDLDHFAKLVHSVPNWKQLFDEAWDSECVTMFERFVNLPAETSEPNINMHFCLIVTQLSRNLRISCMPVDKSAVRIGGVLALPEYDYASVSDVKFVTTDTGKTLFSTEIKTAASWKEGQCFYRDSRLAQILSALYGHGAPALLFTQGQFKVFCENEDRNQIYTFPYGEVTSDSTDTNSFLCYNMHEIFFQVVAICLLREGRGTSTSSAKRKIRQLVQIKPTEKDSPEKHYLREKKKEGKGKSTGAKATAKTPSFVSAFEVDGTPIYQSITVWNVEEEDEDVGEEE